MLESQPILTASLLAAAPAWLNQIGAILLVIFGFSFIVFVHELGHFIVAKWAGVRVDRFAIGFGKELFGFTRGETRYSFCALPVGGYVKMLGQEDFEVDKSGEWAVKEDPRAFSNKPIGKRMAIVSAGVVMNLIFAAVAFAVVYMVGLESISPVIGQVVPASPANLAGVQEGDRLVRMNGMTIRSFQDIKMATVLAEPHEPIDVELLRNGQPVQTRITPTVNPMDGLLWLGVGPGYTTQLAAVSTYMTIPGQPGPEPGDRIVAVDGRRVDSFMPVWEVMLRSNGAPIELDVERPVDPGRADGPSEERRVYFRAPLDFTPAGWEGEGTKNLLGLVPRRRIIEVTPGSRAELAGLQQRDVVVRWDGIDNPNYGEIISSIERSSETDLRVRVLRDGQAVDLMVRPKPSGRWYRRGKPKVGAALQGLEEEAVEVDGERGLVVADILKEVDSWAQPAADLVRPLEGADAPEPMVRGALLMAVDGQAVSSWYDLLGRLRDRAIEAAQAGADVGSVAITYRNPGGAAQTRTMRVPTSIKTGAGLPDGSVILSINDEKWATVRDPQGRDREVSVSYWLGARQILGKYVGRTVEVKYYVVGEWTERATQFSVTQNNLDPWLMRLNYQGVLSSIYPFPHTEPLRVRNPLAGMWVGVKETFYIILQVYTIMERMIFTRTVGLENMSGPVGIVKMGSEIAQSDLNRLLWFLAMISANLAVINFLPLPIVDGGLMVFLLIEKIKGQPVSLKTQVVTQVIGLALIIAAFVFVTVMDLSKF